MVESTLRCAHKNIMNTSKRSRVSLPHLAQWRIKRDMHIRLKLCDLR